jgi:polyisoprenoid-binding protein YceI
MATKWAIDPSHSEVQFKVKHLMITAITGYLQAINWK